jgi:hypothetical protein
MPIRIDTKNSGRNGTLTIFRSPALFLTVISSMIIVIVMAGCGGDDKSNPSNPNPTPGAGFYVSPTGDDGNSGTDQEPLRTLQMAIDNAADSGQITNVYVAAGTYPQTSPLELKSKVHLWGGYNAGNWQRDIEANQTVIQGYADSIAVHGYRADSVIIDGFTIISADASQPQTGFVGNNSIAIALDSCLVVLVSHNNITAGIASAGSVGLRGTNGANGSSGAGGENAGFCPSAGGSGGGNYISGGAGGSGGAFGGFAGANGNGPGGGDGGEGGATGENGFFGWSGNAGYPGANGVGGLSFGNLNGVVYQPANGSAGGVGTYGSGGGGGGGGGGGIVGVCGGGGGGGGGGGRYAGAGGGGYGGGASIAMIFINGTEAIIDTNTIVTISGGNGGGSGPGGTGGFGGVGGAGGADGSLGGAGGPGGRGGSGSIGGQGGGGGGGPIIGILEDAPSQSIRWDNDITLGTPGTGGSQGQAYAGNDGVQQAYRKLN